MIKVVTTEEMRRIEKWAIDRGSSEEAFMLEAGKKIAAAAKQFPGKKVLLIGKENAALAAALELKKAGYDVRTPQEATDFDCDFIIDGLLGATSHLIDAKKPILAIDIPSCKATITIALGFPKLRLFSKDCWENVGKLQIADIGLPHAAIDEAVPSAFIPNFEMLHLPPQKKSQHKYERGFVLGLGGSSALKGAVKLSGFAALHAGAGIVKMFTLEDIGPVADELICQLFSKKLWEEALTKAQSVFIGPGLGRTSAAKELLLSLNIEKPCVVDADALFFLTDFPKKSILTPHAGEMARLLKNTGYTNEQAFVDAKGVILVLKGAPTKILAPGQLPIIIPRGDPGMATAGSGDVLTGILAALLAQGMPLLDAAILGVSLHAFSGEAAALENTSYGYSASDLIKTLPKALELFL